MASYPLPNGEVTQSAAPPITLAFSLSKTPHTTLHLSITPLTTTNLILITTTKPASTSPSALGSFVYAMPNRYNPAEALCTTLYAIPSSVDFATRVARIVAKRTGKPSYVGCSAGFGGVGGEVEEEMEGLKVAVEGILGVIGREAGEG